MRITKTFALAMAMAGALTLSATAASATAFTGNVSTFGGTTGSGPWNLTSEVSPLTYSGIEIDATSPITFNELTDLSAQFNDVAGGASGGSARFSVWLTNGSESHNLQILFGTSPDFNNTVAELNAFSGTNVIGNNDAGRYDTSHFTGGNVFTTYATTAALLGTWTVQEVDLILDGGWTANGRQEMNVSGVSINGTNFAQNTPAPEPLTLSLMGAGLMGLGLMKRRKTAAS